MTVMGWRSENAREEKDEAEARRHRMQWPLLDRVMYRLRTAYWFVALAVLGILYLAAQVF